MQIQIAGIPTYAGGEYSGTELAPDALRQAGLVNELLIQGFDVLDHGNLAMPEALPRHNVPPVRNWPAPRMVWQAVASAARQWFADDSFTLLLGGDCSFEVGTVQAMHSRYGDKTYLVVIDGHVDTLKPDPNVVVGAAAMGLGFLITDNEWTHRLDGFDNSHITVLGYHLEPERTEGITLIRHEQLREEGIATTVATALARLPHDAKILVHFDVDVMQREDMPAAYFPSPTGLSFTECQTLLTAVLSDSRVMALEVTEFSALRDPELVSAKRLVQMLAQALANRS